MIFPLTGMRREFICIFFRKHRALWVHSIGGQHCFFFQAVCYDTMCLFKILCWKLIRADFNGRKCLVTSVIFGKLLPANKNVRASNLLNAGWMRLFGYRQFGCGDLNSFCTGIPGKALLCLKPRLGYFPVLAAVFRSALDAILWTSKAASIFDCFFRGIDLHRKICNGYEPEESR